MTLEEKMTELRKELAPLIKEVKHANFNIF